MVKKKDPIFDYAKVLIKGGKINSLRQLTDFVKLRQISRASDLKYSTLQGKSYKPENYKLFEIVEIARLFDVTPAEVFALALNDYQNGLSPKRKQ